MENKRCLSCVCVNVAMRNSIIYMDESQKIQKPPLKNTYCRNIYPGASAPGFLLISIIM